MSVHSTFFGVTKLTEEDSDKFHRQVKFGRPNKAAADSLRNGRVLLRELDKRGVITLKVKARSA